MVVNILDLQPAIRSYSGPGQWNDPDMLQIGNSGMTLTEYRSHFSLWAMLAAPLTAGTDLLHMKSGIREILTQKGVVAVDQDPFGRPGERVFRSGESAF